MWGNTWHVECSTKARGIQKTMRGSARQKTTVWQDLGSLSAHLRSASSHLLNDYEACACTSCNSRSNIYHGLRNKALHGTEPYDASQSNSTCRSIGKHHSLKEQGPTENCNRSCCEVKLLCQGVPPGIPAQAAAGARAGTPQNHWLHHCVRLWQTQLWDTKK